MRFLVLCATLVMCASGCIEFEPASMTPVKGRAYFVRHFSTITSELWVCDASAGRPVCYPAAPSAADVSVSN